MKTIKLFLPIFVLFVGLFVTACKDEPDAAVVERIVLDQSNLTMSVGDKVTLKAVVSPDNAVEKGVTWSVSNNSVITVSETGEVEAIAEGSSTVVCTSANGTVKASCVVSVGPMLVISFAPNVSKITFSASGKVLYSDGIEIEPTFKVDFNKDNVDWNVEVISTETWCSVEKNIEDKSFILKATANESEDSSPADATIRISGENKYVEFTVSQLKNKFDTYVCGAIYYEMHTGTAAYWKNGVRIELGEKGTHSYTKQILKHNDDIYILGGKGDDIGYWKNDEFVKMETVGSAEPYRMAIVGDDAYVVGYDKLRASIWKNGVKTQLYSKISYAYGICVDGDDIYVIGTIGGKTPTIWKNGTAETFADTEATIYTMVIDNGNTYVAGSVGAQAKYWINGVRYNPIINEEASLNSNSLAVHNGKVYLAGDNLNEWGTYYASYWIDGECFSLKGDPAYPSSAESIKFFEDDLYVVGSEKDFEIVSHAAYWKNGKIIILDNQTFDTKASDILIIPTK